MKADHGTRAMFRLCAQLGVLHPDHLQDYLTHRQLQEWFTYMEVEPFGSPADDYRMATTAWAAVVPHAGKRRLEVSHFMPQWTGKSTPSPAEYKQRAMAAYAAAMPKVR